MKGKGDMGVDTGNRIWMEHGTVRAIVDAGGFVPLEILVDGAVIARPVPSPVEGAPGRVEIAHPLPPSVLSDGVRVLVLRRQGEVDALASMPLVIGRDGGASLAAELALLREELELVKSVLRERLRRGI